MVSGPSTVNPMGGKAGAICGADPASPPRSLVRGAVRSTRPAWAAGPTRPERLHLLLDDLADLLLLLVRQLERDGNLGVGERHVALLLPLDLLQALLLRLRQNGADFLSLLRLRIRH